MPAPPTTPPDKKSPTPPGQPLPVLQPELWHLIISKAEPCALICLRATSTALRDACDSVLARNVSLHGQYADPETSQSILYVVVSSPSGRPIPAIGPKEGFPLPSPHEPLPDSLQRMLGFTRTLNVREYRGDSYWPFPHVVGLDKLVGYVNTLAPAFKKLGSIRFWTSSAKGSAYGIRETAETELSPSLPLSTVICEGVVHCGVGNAAPFFRINSPIPQTAKTIVINVNIYHKRFDYGSNFTTDNTRSQVLAFPPAVQAVIIVLTYDFVSDPMYTSELRCFFDGIQDKRRPDLHYTFIDLTPTKHPDPYLGPYGTTRSQALRSSIRERFTHAKIYGPGEFQDKRLLGMYAEQTYDDTGIDMNGYKVVDDGWLSRELYRLEKAFLSQKAAFSCGGTIKANGTTLYLANAPKAFRFPISDKDAQRLLESCFPSPFGNGDELIFDESYRLAREMKPPHFGLSSELLARDNVLQHIQKRLLISGTLYAKVAKINAYGTGGFFKSHRDTPRGDNHIGTITLCLPSNFTVGELVVRHNGKKVIHNWEPSNSSDSTTASWAFLFADCDHEVLPVTSGIRVTVAYDVFTKSSASTQSSVSSTLVDSLQRIMDSRYILQNGGVLAFGLQHCYPIEPGKEDTGFKGKLKGIDLSWSVALSKLGLRYEIVAVCDEYVKASHGDDEDMGDDGDPETYRLRRYVVSRDFNAIYTDECAFSEHVPFCGEVLGEQGEEVIWVTEPSSWATKHTYMTYGNEPSAGSEYVAAALYVYVGPPGKRTEPVSRDFKEARLAPVKTNIKIDEEEWDSSSTLSDPPDWGHKDENYEGVRRSDAESFGDSSDGEVAQWRGIAEDGLPEDESTAVFTSGEEYESSDEM